MKIETKIELLPCCLDHYFPYSILSRRVAKGGGGRGEGNPAAQIKQVQFDLNIKHGFFDAMA